jgi:Carboxypeptidase regulatory-like domain
MTTLDKSRYFIFLRHVGRTLAYSSPLVICLLLYPAYAGENATLTGSVQDTDGKPVPGAEVSVYTGPNVRGTADFISPKTDSDGKYSIVLPQGRYWAVARVRQSGGQFGPIMLGDKHSGDAVEIELTQGGREVNFTVADLKEAAALSEKKTNVDTIAIRGHILDKKGKPVQSAYAFANISRQISEIPDYLSSWVDEDGQYTIFLPRGKYFFGCATAFPPGPHAVFYKEIMLDRDQGNVDIVTPDE